MIVELKTPAEEDSRSAPERGKNHGINVFEEMGSVLEGINGNASFTVIHVFKCVH